MDMDKIISKIVGLGVPGLVLLGAMATSGFTGGAAIVTALAFLGGPLGMIGGIGLLAVLVLISKGLSEYGFEAIFKGVIKSMKKEGKTKEMIISKINNYHISKQLKLVLLDYINQYWVDI